MEGGVCVVSVILRVEKGLFKDECLAAFPKDSQTGFT